MVSYQLTGPDGHALHKYLKQSTGTVSITAEKDGRHEYCFSNQMSTVIDKLVRYVESIWMDKILTNALFSFNVHGVIYVDGDGQVLAQTNMHPVTDY
jgi:p24 family protein beta-1